MASSQKSQPVPLLNMRSLTLLLSTFFFALCAYVNLNDPDPSFWVGMYLAGSAVCFFSIGELLPHFVPEMLGLYCLWIIYELYNEMINSTAFKDTFHSHLNSWEFFETEQGREIGGLVYLIFGLILSRLPASSKSSAVKSLYFVGSAAMVGGIYATLYLQPEMNKTNFVEHCSGTF
mmetsp:Transcript_1432/g.1897  ORF Transcript_1432/g.1897 Transcript_1432/m.1897 type:complete len:176 (+) Transcript_1432:70-597(+)